MGKESGYGTMDKFTKENGSWEQRTDMELGSLQREIHTKDNGS